MDGPKAVTATFRLLDALFDVSIERSNNDPVQPGDTALFDVTIINAGEVTATVQEISATLTALVARLAAAGVIGGEPVPCGLPVTLAVGEIHRCTLMLVVPAAGAVELALTVTGEGANNAPINATVNTVVTLALPTGLDETEEPVTAPNLFLPLVGR
jgi:predicted deacylase